MVYVRQIDFKTLNERGSDGDRVDKTLGHESIAILAERSGA